MSEHDAILLAKELANRYQVAYEIWTMETTGHCTVIRSGHQPGHPGYAFTLFIVPEQQDYDAE